MEGLMADPAACSIGREEELHWLALTLVPGLGTRMAGKLLDRFRTPQAVFRASRSELVAAGLNGGVAQSVASGCSFEDALDQQRKMAEHGAAAIVRSDPRYPALLREIFDPPIMLFARGRMELLQPFHRGGFGLRRGRDLPFGKPQAGRRVVHQGPSTLGVCHGIHRLSPELPYPQPDYQWHERRRPGGGRRPVQWLGHHREARAGSGPGGLRGARQHHIQGELGP